MIEAKGAGTLGAFRFFPSKSQPLRPMCHSEERSDEESLIPFVFAHRDSSPRSE